MRPPPKRSENALQRRAEKRGRTLEEQRALDRSVLELAAKERNDQRQASKTAKAAAASRGASPLGERTAAGASAGDAPQAGLPLSLERFVANEGRGLVGHRLECEGRGAAKVLSARRGEDTDSLVVKLRFAAPVPSGGRDGPAQRTLQLTLSSVDVLAGRFRLADDSLADWRCSACSFRNFGSRLACNQCHARRFAPTAGVGAPLPAVVAKRVPAAKKTNIDPKRAWEGSVVPAGQVEANKRLRERLKADPTQLSDAERERAEQLVLRDARKRDKKAARKARIAAGVAAPGWRARTAAH
ncbi:hypothetical protein KFE25_009182 [Diacronema lutheri]|uniref:RanBP2-type domain-containing protein n=1 Tax=Diacronema lutheri TaxID=2081491 RepID=A0A8J5XXB2_DIALT|nr:hypothetical protein KFE25_009182 [Diacronema lutheri]